MLHTLNPVLVRTSNHSYVHLLSRRGVTALRLPLFGHLPPPASDIVPEGPGLTFAFFGTLHPVWPPEPLMSYLKSLGVSVTLAHIGHIGAGEALWNRLERDYGQVFTFRRLGGRPAQEIANFLAACDFGVAATPWALLGKSASATAMVECGLPVIVNRDDVRFAGLNDSPADRPAVSGAADAQTCACTTSRGERRRPPHQRLPLVTDQFLADLQGKKTPARAKAMSAEAIRAFLERDLPSFNAGVTLPVAGYALPPASLALIGRCLEHLNVRRVFEFGTGLSTDLFLGDAYCHVTRRSKTASGWVAERCGVGSTHRHAGVLVPYRLPPRAFVRVASRRSDAELDPAGRRAKRTSQSGIRPRRFAGAPAISRARSGARLAPRHRRTYRH